VSRLSAIVTTYNEADMIGETLTRLAFADEIIVVDSFSTDGTPDIARRSGARVLQHEYESPAAQKNWAIPQAARDWVLIVDSDEWVTPELAAEIERTIASPSADGYEIRRRSFFLGHEIKRSGWQRDWVLRLVRRDRARYEDRQVHELMVCDGPVGRLNGTILHYSYRSMDDFWKKLRRYAEWNAAEALRQGRTVSPLYMLLHPPARFLKAYLLQGGFLDGAHGLVVCLLTAVYAAAKDIRIWEMWQNRKTSQ
jgi:glycosyltransferase involved in cell wall biosynthesis